MSMWKLSVAAVFSQQVAALITTQNSIITQWNYNGHGKNWGFSCNSGPQSPIELPVFMRESLEVTTLDPTDENTPEELLLYRYPETLWPNFNDDGRSVWGNFESDVQTGGFGTYNMKEPSGDAGTIKRENDGYEVTLDRKFQLRQVIVHSPGEHSYASLDGKQADVEIQLVHEDESHGLAIVALAFTQDGAGTTSKLLDSLQHALEIKDAAFSPGNATAEFSEFFKRPDQMSSRIQQSEVFRRYTGSGSVPPCKASVEWFVNAVPRTVNVHQAQFFRDFIRRSSPERRYGNSRNVQKYIGVSKPSLIAAVDASSFRTKEEHDGNGESEFTSDAEHQLQTLRESLNPDDMISWCGGGRLLRQWEHCSSNHGAITNLENEKSEINTKILNLTSEMNVQCAAAEGAHITADASGGPAAVAATTTAHTFDVACTQHQTDIEHLQAELQTLDHKKETIQKLVDSSVEKAKSFARAIRESEQDADQTKHSHGSRVVAVYPHQAKAPDTRADPFSDDNAEWSAATVGQATGDFLNQHVGPMDLWNNNQYGV